MVDSRWQAAAALVDPVRRALYEYVRRQDHPVTREEAADAHAISRNLTAFHLDKLVDASLLRARYEAPADQPRGRGRTPKVYEPAGDGVDVTVPPRQYALAGEILADSIADQPENTIEAARRHAFDHGRRLAQTQPRRPTDDRLATARAALAGLGFDPRPEASAVSLLNCPFHALAVRQPELICGLNLSFVSGLLAGLGCHDLRAELRPQPGRCCVVVRQSSRRS